ncbi:hypothetical protein GCM10022403_005850 [Streptomyces coacervatus]|uniref:Secreted protein n=1 Tax=Streptomyces coacervatus TaxID=647381 RepID=A0ABP7GSW7_9ACTN
MFTSRRPAAQVPAACALMASAPTTRVRMPARSAGVSTPSSEGTTLATCTSADSTSARSSAGSARSAAPATTSRAPADKATATSSTDASKLNEANCSTPTPGPAPKTGRNAAAALARERWLTATPFGRPVDPEV